VLIAAEKASISLELIVEIRNKVLDAYSEIMRMQI
jgi:flagellar hook-basal body complex protein FliE